MVSRAGALRPLTMFRGCRAPVSGRSATSSHMWFRWPRLGRSTILAPVPSTSLKRALFRGLPIRANIPYPYQARWMREHVRHDGKSAGTALQRADHLRQHLQARYPQLRRSLAAPAEGRVRRVALEHHDLVVRVPEALVWFVGPAPRTLD